MAQKKSPKKKQAGSIQAKSTGKVKLKVGGKTFEMPVVVGTEGEKAVDISELRAKTSYLTLDHGYGNTGSCLS